MLARRADQGPALAGTDERRLGLDALEDALADLVHRPPDDGAARLRRSVREVQAGLPAAIVGFVGYVEDQEATHRGLAGSHLQGLAVVRGLDAFGHRLRQLAARVDVAL